MTSRYLPEQFEGVADFDIDINERIYDPTGSAPPPPTFGTRRPRHHTARFEPADLAALVARVGCAFTRFGLTPPYALPAAAQQWLGMGIAVNAIMNTVEAYLRAYAERFQAGDRLLTWIDHFLSQTALPDDRPRAWPHHQERPARPTP